MMRGRAPRPFQRSETRIDNRAAVKDTIESVASQSSVPVIDNRCSVPNGQTLVEFAFILPILLILMLGVVQAIVVGGAALAVNQAAVACTRYAALNPDVDQGAIATYLRTVASPLINDAKLNSPTLSGTPPRSTGTPVAVTVTYDLTG